MNHRVNLLVVGIRQRAWIAQNMASVVKGPLSTMEEQWLQAQVARSAS